MKQEIVEYIIQAQKHGLSEFEIKQNLLNAGWEAGLIEQSLVFARATENRPDNIAAEISHAHVRDTQSPLPNSKEIPKTFQVSHPNVTISEQHFAASPHTSRFSKKAIFGIVVVVLLVLAGSAYGYYSYVLANPTKIWDKFLQTPQNQVYQTKYNFSYFDPGEVEDSSGLIGFPLKDIKLELDGNGYLNGEDVNMPETNSKLQYTFSSGNTSFSTGFEAMLTHNILYFNIGNNPLLDALSKELNDGKKIDWIKIDLTELKKQSEKQQSEAKFLQQLSSPEFKEQLQKIWEDAKLIKIEKYLGREKINGVTVLHYKNSLDKQALKGLTGQYADKFMDTLKGTEVEIKPEDMETVKEIFAQLIEKIEIKEFETWVGMTDFRLYRVHVVTNAPSFISLVQNIDDFSAPQNNDAKRLSDIRQMASALELYYNDKTGYPDGKDGLPLNLTPTYIGLVPTAPTPADGKCTDYYNSYWYQPMGQKHVYNGETVYDSYELTFCLGNATGGYPAGLAKLTQAGIESNIPCPGQEVCTKEGVTLSENDQMKQEIKDFIDALDFSAEIKVNADYTDYGKKIQLLEPTGAFDVMDIFNEAQSTSEDATRLADIRQLASAEELYFNDNNDYSDKLEDLSPTYMGMIPVAPAATSEACTEADNTYTYQKVSQGKYSLTFCLGNAMGGFEQGKHTLTQAGIQ